MKFDFRTSKVGRSPIVRAGLAEYIADGAADCVLTLISAPAGSGKQALLERIMTILETIDRPGSITIIPDLDGLDDSAQAELTRNIDSRQGRHIVATHHPAPFDLARLRLDGDVTDISIEDLALTASDITCWLGKRYGIEAGNRHLITLMETTGGWSICWRLISEMLDEGMPLGEIADTFTGAHPQVSTFIEKTVLTDMPATVRDCLMEVGGLDPLSVELAISSTGRADAFALLDTARQKTGFVKRVGSLKSFQLHPVFRDVLRDSAERSIPVRLNHVRAAAADWYEERSDWLAAAKCHSDAGNTDQAISLLMDNADELVTGQGEVSKYRELTRKLPTKDASQLAPEIALGAVFSGDFAGAAALLEDTEHKHANLSKQQCERREALAIVIDYGFERFDEVAAAAPTWLHAHANSEPRFRSMVAASLFFSCYANLNTAGAGRAVSTFRECLRKTRSPFLEGWLAIMDALRDRDFGRIRDAERALDARLASGAIRPAVEVARAKIAWDLGDISRAQQLISRNLEPGLRHSTVDVALLGWETAIDLAALDSGMDEAMLLASKAEATMSALHGERGRRSIRLIRATVLLKTPNFRPSTDLSSEIEAVSRNIDLFGPGLRLREQACLLRARHEALRGEPRQAISIVQPIIREALQQSRLTVWCEATLIYAGALVRIGAHERAARLAWAAIERVAPAGLRAAIATEHVLLAPILDELMSRAKLITGLDETGTRAAVQDLAGRAGRTDSLVTNESSLADEIEADVKLTETEQRILELAAGGASNSDISKRMMTKLSTVKWHMQNILRKLDAPSRTAAVAAARRIGLLA